MGLTVTGMGPAIRKMMKEEMQDILNKLDGYDIPEDPETQQKICDHACKLKTSNFHWPNHKVARKTAEYFNLKKSLIIQNA